MIYFKSCPNCGGDMYAYEDEEGYLIKCLMCARIVYSNNYGKVA